MAFEYTRLETGDGSPTLRLSPEGEAMHASGGAFTETQYIYQPPVEKAFQSVENPAFISVGLGLGYNEILIAAESLKYKRLPSLIQSYESVTDLRKCFAKWLANEDCALGDIYDAILHLYEKKYSLHNSEIKNRLQDLYEQKKGVLAGAIDETTVPPASHGILFDAFSSKTSPLLWTEDFLNVFFKNASAQPCFVSTYACTGALKRALKNNGFTVEIKKGFDVKRESTFAVKN